MSENSYFSLTLKLTGHLFLAGVGFGVAWVFWNLTVPQFWLFGVFAALFALGGAIRLSKALILLGQLIVKHVRMANFQAKGAAPKADQLARNSDLKHRGLLK